VQRKAVVQAVREAMPDLELVQLPPPAEGAPTVFCSETVGVLQAAGLRLREWRESIVDMAVKMSRSMRDTQHQAVAERDEL